MWRVNVPASNIYEVPFIKYFYAREKKALWISEICFITLKQKKRGRIGTLSDAPITRTENDRVVAWNLLSYRKAPLFLSCCLLLFVLRVNFTQGTFIYQFWSLLKGICCTDVYSFLFPFVVSHSLPAPLCCLNLFLFRKIFACLLTFSRKLGLMQISKIRHIYNS